MIMEKSLTREQSFQFMKILGKAALDYAKMEEIWNQENGLGNILMKME